MKRNTNSIREDRGTFSYRLIGYIVMSIISILCLIPFWLMLSGSFSDEADIIVNGFSLWPRVYSLKAYQSIFANGGRIVRAYEVTIFVTAVGAGISILATSMTGYVLQRQDFKYRNGLSFFIYFTTLFSGGLVPWYILIINLGLKNSVWALILPTLMSPWHIMLMRNFIRSIPFEVVEAAKIDGAGDWKIYTSVILPLAKGGLAAVGLFIALKYWNDWYLANLFMNNENGYPLQYLLYQMLSSAEFLKSAAAANVDISAVQAPTDTLKLATAMVVTGPILLLYPFVQRYFVKGITIGAVKG